MYNTFTWQAVEESRCYGVAHYNLDVGEEGCGWGWLGVNLGEAILIKAEYKDWFFAKKIDSEEEGILPKAYIHIKDCSVIRNEDSEIIIYPKTPPLAQEINAALQEWYKIAKELYVQCNIHIGDWSANETESSKKFTVIRQLIENVHDYRRKVISSNLTVEGLKELKKDVAARIDFGNTLLRLDMIVRDELGNPMDPLSTSTIELFRAHQNASKKFKKNNRGSKVGSGVFAHSSHTLIITVESIKWRIVDECELRFFLYDARPNKEREEAPFTESVQVNFKAGVPPKTPFKFLFTDLGKSDFDRGKVYLVAYVVRIGPMELKEVESKRDNVPFADKRNNIQVRRPYGVAAKDITYLFRSSNQPPDNELQPINYVPCVGEETMEDTLKKLIFSLEQNTNGGTGKDNGKAVGLFVKMIMMAGNPNQIQEEKPLLLMRGNPIIARKMGFPEVILPNDIRNDLYINLVRGEFHRTAKTTDRNVELSISVHNEGGACLGRILSGGNGSPPVHTYKSLVHYHNDKPRWNEYLRISLPMSIEEFSTAHIKFTFKHRSSSESKDKSEKPFALAYLKLKEPEGTAIKDAAHDLTLYKIDSKYYRESEVQYLSLPSTRTATWQGASTKPSCPGFSCSSKDSFYIKTTLCSTNFTQNADLLELLLWVTKLRQVAENTLAQNPHIRSEELVNKLLEALRKILEKMTNVSGEEIVKFLNPIFDALFLILVDPMEQIQTELRSGSGRQSILRDFLNTNNSFVCQNGGAGAPPTCDRSVFECLLHIFGLMLDHKFQNFQSVLNLYIEDNFSSTLAYNKLAIELENSIKTDPPKTLLNVMKCLEFYFKFIIKSFEIHKRLRNIEFGRTEKDRDDEENFEQIIESLFKSLCYLLSKPGGGDLYVGAEGMALKQIPRVIGDLVKVFPPRKLSENLVELICVIPAGKLTSAKLSCITDIVHSELFAEAECRFMLLPIVAQNIQFNLPGNDEEMKRKSIEMAKARRQKKLEDILGIGKGGTGGGGTGGEEALPKNPYEEPSTSTHSEEMEKSVELLGDVMDILHHQPYELKESHICYTMQILIRPIIFSIGTIGQADPHAGNMVAIFLALLREMKSYHYGILINKLKGETGIDRDPYKQGLLKFINDVLVVMKNLFNASYFPGDWAAMTLLQNSIVLNALQHFAETIKTEFSDPFEEHPWNNFFICAVSFLTQGGLQLEEFFPAKRNYILGNYGDMRRAGVEMIRGMWFSIGKSKRIKFVPGMVGTFLEMAFVPEGEVRALTIPIFYDMMHCEFDQDRPIKSFKEVEDELTKRIVEGVEGGKGDHEFRNIFFETMTNQCQHNTIGLKEQGLSMVSTVTKLMDLLLQYREVMEEEDAGSRMSCIVNLLDFSKEIDRKELYLRYLYKLHDLHVRWNNWAEAGFALKLHSRLLEWSDEEVPNLLRMPNRHPNLTTHIELKEALYSEIISYFDKAKMWECALEVCDELRQQYEDVFSYSKLPKLHRQIASFYDKILDQIRYEPEYFRVAFYGSGFPSFLQDKVYVYRGLPFEKLSEFESRLMCRYLQAELLKTLGTPSDEIRFSNKQYLQICKVDPVQSTSKRISGMRYADENIRKYYRVNEIDKFTFSRPYHSEPKDKTNEFASLWLDRYTLWTSATFPGLMSWFPVVRDSLTKVRPILNALETLERANDKMRELILLHCLNPNEDIKELSMKLGGILDAAVMGGVVNYEKAFLTPEYLAKNPGEGGLIEQLKRLICLQVPIIDECLKIHERRCSPSMFPWQKRLDGLFTEFVSHVESTYGMEKKDLVDEILSREMGRAVKKQQALVKRYELANQHPSRERGEFLQSGAAGHRGSTALSRTLGSTVSLYQNAASSNKPKVLGGGGSISKSNNYFRRSTHSHSSFSGSMEGDQLTSLNALHSNNNPPPASATLPRNGHFFGGGSNSMLPPLSDSSENHDSLIPLTQTLISQRPPRVGMEQRKSQSWTESNHRYSNASLISGSGGASLETLRPEGLTNSSLESAMDAESADEVAPPLPPKLQRNDKMDGPVRPPTPPPKKPPLKQLREM